jgi:hypothetical protein
MAAKRKSDSKDSIDIDQDAEPSSKKAYVLATGWVVLVVFVEFADLFTDLLHVLCVIGERKGEREEMEDSYHVEHALHRQLAAVCSLPPAHLSAMSSAQLIASHYVQASNLLLRCLRRPQRRTCLTFLCTEYAHAFYSSNGCHTCNA